jgi:hypothetical protein
MTQEQNEEAATSKTKKKFRFKKRDLAFVFIGVVVAFGLRFVLVDAVTTHYHANFAMYVNGVRDEFKSPTFYEEISSCSATNHDNPKTRVHMHGQEFDTVHVHDDGSTWGHFFANLSYTLGDKVLVTDNGVFVDGSDGKKLRFILNGNEISSVANLPIESEDKLLIDFSSDDQRTLQSRYSTISSTAHEHNEKPDPASCSGGAKETLKDRFTRTLGTTPAKTEHHD